ncbi:ABC transporter ATP-binding protein [Microvirga antarctica]|uniref:ABC transporter ATP-binding protein n=1 Tax=Microvirga antarctica TaxID=2819233 RepID=UPI001B3067DB|nr:dipeptide ABC transporter ATP-binding protein [Microvirga antarctica]
MLPDDVLIQVKGLRKYFPVRKGMFGSVTAHIKAVDGVDLTIKKGETISLVGESGCGKSTTGRSIMRLIEPTGGEVLFRSQVLGGADGQEAVVDVATLSAGSVKALRREMQIIFQDPYSSLDPRMTVGELIGEPLRVQLAISRKERDERVVRLLEAVGLGADHRRRFPHEFSGGQRQRIGIARALALNPRFIVADEPVSALDVSIQAQVVNLLQDLQAELGLTYLFIAHDLSVVRHISDRVAVMYLGKIVEIADADELFSHPRHPYTEALLSAVPVADPDFVRNRIRLQGDVPNPSAPPSGCPFHPRCAYAVDRCKAEIPSLRETSPGHQASCHRVEELDLSGVDTRYAAA